MPGVTAVGGWIVEYPMLGMISGKGPQASTWIGTVIGNPICISEWSIPWVILARILNVG